MASVSRNDPCPCGSGKKYKHCHLGKELPSSVTGEGSAVSHVATWKIFVAGLVVILIVSGALWIAGLERAAQIVGGLAAIVLMIYSAFRKPPAPRDTPGDAAGINFGK